MFVETLAQTPSRLGFALLMVLGLLLVVVLFMRDPRADRLEAPAPTRPILSGPHPRRRLRRPVVVCAALFGMAAALWWAGLAPSQGPARAQPDAALASLSLPPPVVASQAAALIASELPERSLAVLAMRRAFFAGDIEVLEDGVRTARAEYFDQAQPETTMALLLDGMSEARLAMAGPCEDWLRRRPGSYAAHWLCGELWAAEASRAHDRGAAYRLRSTVLLERALELDPRPVEAHLALVGNRMAAGERDMALAHLQRAEQLLPAYLPVHKLRLHYAQAAGGRSGTAAGEALERARAAGIAGSALLDLEDALTRPSAGAAEGALRTYWDNAVRQHPTRTRFDGLLRELARAGNWHAARPVASSMAAAHPHDPAAHYWLAMITERLGLPAEALESYRMAAALGHEQALQQLMLAHVRGGFGLPGGSPEQVLELCWYAAALGSPVGANCIATAYLVRERSGLALPHDPLRGLAWHLHAARGGHAGSQFALGSALYEGQLTAVRPEEARALGLFWLRRAAAQDHAQARQALERAGDSGSEAGWRALARRFEPLRMVQAAIDALVSGLRTVR